MHIGGLDQIRAQSGEITTSIDGLSLLQTYQDFLNLLDQGGQSHHFGAKILPQIFFFEPFNGLKKLFSSLSTLAPAVAGTNAEEWNPLSQRPHAPLLPRVDRNAFGAEVLGLKEALDGFATLTHEVMHVALWEPFFTGKWRPRSQKIFEQFSLLAEGYCFFYTDIIVSGNIRVRLPDGEFAFERHSPGNALFHPIKAFHALNITDPLMILKVYLDGFSGEKTDLWQTRGSHPYPTHLAKQAFEFYAGSLSYLKAMHHVFAEFGLFDDYARRYCQIPGLPALLPPKIHESLLEGDVKSYFVHFFRFFLTHLDEISSEAIDAVRFRRMLQTRAYYAKQVQWVLVNGHYTASSDFKITLKNKLVHCCEHYLEELHKLLFLLAQPNQRLSDLVAKLQELDRYYERHLRTYLQNHKVWVSHRWLIAPQRGTGLISLKGPQNEKLKAAKKWLVLTIDFVIDELTKMILDEKKADKKTELLSILERVARVGAENGDKELKNIQRATKALKKVLSEEALLPCWSVPLAGFNPLKNSYRELLFSYQ